MIRYGRRRASRARPDIAIPDSTPSSHQTDSVHPNRWAYQPTAHPVWDDFSDIPINWRNIRNYKIHAPPPPPPFDKAQNIK